MLRLPGGRRLCVALRTLATEGHTMTPVSFCLMDESGPQGHILIQVDDLATHGTAVHAENMAKL